jgi:hypothetical protein
MTCVTTRQIQTFLGFIPLVYTSNSHSLIRITSEALHIQHAKFSYQNYKYCPLQWKEGSQSRNKAGKKALGLYTQIVLNEISNILLVKNLDLQYYALQNGNVWVQTVLENSTPLHHPTLTTTISSV